MSCFAPGLTAASTGPFIQVEYSDDENVLDDPDLNTSMLWQPETRPISHDQLVAEIKGIYAGLIMVEAKCIDIDEKQRFTASEVVPNRTSLTNDQWQPLIALHKQLLREHHDFFLASHHPSASSNLIRLATKYSMPARMWRHGIHAFLEVLRHRLPTDRDHMLAFIYIAYAMMALLYETVATFEDTWIECLGDLGRYRMTIEDTWIECPGDLGRYRMAIDDDAKYWNNKASDKTPSAGRLYRHLAMLARPYTLERCARLMKSLYSAMVIRASFIFMSLKMASARPTSTSRSDTSTITYEAFLTSLLYMVLAAIVMGVAHLLAKAKGPMSIYGTLMAVTSLGWWAIRGDDAPSTGIQWMYVQ